MAGVQASATQLVGRSVDGWTAGMPTAWVMDPAREPMIAVQMNDEPLPPEHGFPARLIIPGLYGYVSATKWLAELELTTLESFDGYWIPRGWSKEAPILTQSRIDTPRGGAGLTAGRVPIAGIAWAPDRGISKVEVAVDGALARRPPGAARSPTRPGSSGSSTGTRHPAITRSRSVPRTAMASSRRSARHRPLPMARAAGIARPCTFRRPRHGRIGIESGHASTALHLRPPGTLRRRHHRRTRATGRSSCRRATASAS